MDLHNAVIRDGFDTLDNGGADVLSQDHQKRRGGVRILLFHRRQMDARTVWICADDKKKISASVVDAEGDFILFRLAYPAYFAARKSVVKLRGDCV